MSSKAENFDNPLEEQLRSSVKVADPCILVIFGATGDLTARKLMPALYNLARDGQLPAHFVCVGFARREKSHEMFRKEMYDAVNKFSRVKPVDDNLWKTFSQQLFYHQSEFDDDAGYDKLHQVLKGFDITFGTKGNRVFYLSTQPSYFPDVIQRLSLHGLIYPIEDTQYWSRVIIEKPFGHDLKSAVELQGIITRYLNENQIYRIDHYLGKETVQNILVLRFANAVFESVWNNNYIDHVQITAAEDIGIGTRGRFWEEAGMLRDIVQNHMMQLLSLMAMEPPNSLKADAIRNEKVKVLESIRPFPLTHMDSYAIRGQYGPGVVNGEAVKGYSQEDNVSPESQVETYVALKLFIDNWRWAGVPFYLRAGKRLAKRATEIAITFKNAPDLLFQTAQNRNNPNVLVIRIQPDEGVSLGMNCKIPGLPSPLLPVKMDFRYGSYFGITPPDAYERLICDCMSGDSTLFARSDEVMASWKLFTPLLRHWETHMPTTPFPNYASGSWGPVEADNMLARDHYHQWRLL